MSSINSVNIHITDFDDQGPKFAQSSYRATIKENLSIVSSTSCPAMHSPFVDVYLFQQGSTVLTVSAFDQDKGSGQNHAVSYSIKSGNDGGAFEVDSTSGELRVKNSLDREKQGLYSLILEVMS